MPLLSDTTWKILAGILGAGLVVLIMAQVRRQFGLLARALPRPSATPYFSPDDIFRFVQCYMKVASASVASGGDGYHVAVGEDGIQLGGLRLLGAGQGLWIPWAIVESCEPLDVVDPGGRGQRGGAVLVLRDPRAEIRIGDPAGDRVYGYWRLYHRHHNLAAAVTGTSRSPV